MTWQRVSGAALAQQDSSDVLGMALDGLLRYARTGDESARPCPKAIACAHAQLLHERSAIESVKAAPASDLQSDAAQTDIDELRAIVADCLTAAQSRDHEVAHAAEIELRRRALELIAGGHPNPIRIASIALSTEAIDFARYTA